MVSKFSGLRLAEISWLIITAEAMTLCVCLSGHTFNCPGSRLLLTDKIYLQCFQKLLIPPW